MEIQQMEMARKVARRYRIRRRLTPPLSSPHCEFGRILVFEHFLQNILYKKLYHWTYYELYLLILLFFLFKYDAVIIKHPSNCSFGKKVVKLRKILKNKNHWCQVPSQIWENIDRLGELENVEYRSIPYSLLYVTNCYYFPCTFISECPDFLSFTWTYNSSLLFDLQFVDLFLCFDSSILFRNIFTNHNFFQVQLKYNFLI